MEHGYWNDWYSGWGWFLWFGIWFLFIFSLGNWGYSYRAHRKYDRHPLKNAMEILNERYASGKIARDEYVKIKMEISSENS